MNTFTIRRATEADLPAILPVYESARRYMRATGNMTQWTGGYPGREVLLADVTAGALHVVLDGASLAGVFALYHGDEPTYARIEAGTWSRDAAYAYVHRVASAGIRGGGHGRSSTTRSTGRTISVSTPTRTICPCRTR